MDSENYERQLSIPTNTSESCCNSNPEISTTSQSNVPQVTIVLYGINTSFNPLLTQQLHRLQYFHIVEVDDIDEWVDSMTSHPNETTVVLIVQKFQFDVIQVLHEGVPQIKRIYSIRDQHGMSIHDGHGRAALRNAYIDISAMVDDLCTWVKQNSVNMNKTKSSHSLYGEPAVFMWYQFFFSLLTHLEPTSIAFREFIAASYTEFNDNEKSKRDVEEFERSYTPEKAIYWYSKESFLYPRVNPRLISQDIDAVFEFRSILLDLQKQLQHLNDQQKNKRKGEFIQVYRGQPMTPHEIQYFYENEGNVVAISPLVSTSRRRSVAEIYAGGGLYSSELCGGMLIIRISSHVQQAIHADLDGVSAFPQERETLICWRSLFRVDEVKLQEPRRYEIRLTLIDEHDPQYHQQLMTWRTSLGDRSFFTGRSTQLYMRDLNEANGPFLSYQVLIDIVLRLKPTVYAKQEMFEYCRTQYATSPGILAQIDKFEKTYTSENAAKWYTKDSFLYRLLNSTLRLEKIDRIFKLRLFIQDLHNQLHVLQEEYIRTQRQLHTDVLTLYRGQVMTKTELDEFKIGSRMSVNCFLSTTVNRTTAYDLACDFDDVVQDPDVSVVYEITVDLTVPHSTPFASIADVSVNPDEREVLFSMAAVFEITDIVQEKERVWKVKLTVVNKADESWNVLTAHL
ncbi:unnamed protein product [Adineta ricciae]|uniref:NAD(P)(+)--arginine ADP-ribosyltransferase n=1 Tax=Adineta ricciae TaxID=249248 RepID=A0A815BV21_ADIRI|nr:unnamed protein product [Adineta ricciae]CAF1325822.1 unnamed protein product [Adineta ricciae]